MQQGSAKKILSNLLKVAISVGGLAYIFWKVPFAEVCGHWTAQALPWILLILFCTVFSMAIQANRWRGLLLDEGKKIKFRTFYAYIALGYFFNNLLPTGFGGDAVKSLAFGKKFNQTSQSVSAVFLSRIQGLLAMFLCFFIALPFAMTKINVPTAYTLVMCAVLLICIVIILCCLFSDKIPFPEFITNKISFIPKFQYSLSIYRKTKTQLLLSSLDSLWLQLLSLFTSFAYFKAVGVDINIGILVVFTSITIVVAMLPVSLNGIGVREGVQIALFSGILGIPADLVLAAGLLGYIPLLFQALQGAVVLVRCKKD